MNSIKPPKIVISIRGVHPNELKNVKGYSIFENDKSAY
jgi:hypothetical protein